MGGDKMTTNLIVGQSENYVEHFKLLNGSEDMGAVGVVIDRARRTVKYNKKCKYMEADGEFQVGLNKFIWNGWKVIDSK